MAQPVAAAATTATQTLTTVTPEIHKVAPISGFVTLFGVSINPMVIALAIVLGCVVYTLWKAQREAGRNTFDVYDLIMDTLPDGKRRASGIKCTYQTAFIVSTWVVIDQEIKGILTEGLFFAYLSVWCASLIAKVVFDKPDATGIINKIDK